MVKRDNPIQSPKYSSHFHRCIYTHCVCVCVCRQNSCTYKNKSLLDLVLLSKMKAPGQGLSSAERGSLCRSSYSFTPSIISPKTKTKFEILEWKAKQNTQNLLLLACLSSSGIYSHPSSSSQTGHQGPQTLFICRLLTGTLPLIVSPVI